MALYARLPQNQPHTTSANGYPGGKNNLNMKPKLVSWTQAPAKDLCKRARASEKDGDNMCATLRSLAAAKATHEEEVVFKAFWKARLLPQIPFTHVDLGPDLRQHPCFRPQDFFGTMAHQGRLGQLIGVAPESSARKEFIHVVYAVGL